MSDSPVLPPPSESGGARAPRPVALAAGSESTCVLCGAELDGDPVCRHCLADQQAPAAHELRAVKLQLRTLIIEMEDLRARVRDLEVKRTGLESSLRPRRPLPAPGSARATPPGPSTMRPVELRAERVRDILLWAGAALVVVSAFSLAAVMLASGGGDGPPLVTPTRVALALIALAVVTAAVSWLIRRRLAATAEVLVVVALGLVMAGWYLLRRGGVADAVSVEGWWGAGFALAGVFSAAAGLAGYRIVRGLGPAFLATAAAIGLAALPGDLWFVASAAAGMAAAFVALARVALARPGWRVAAYTSLLAAAGLTLAGVCLAAVAAADATTTRAALGPAAAMVALSTLPALARALLRHDLERLPPALDVLVGLSTMLLITGVTFVATPRWSASATIAITALAGLVAIVVGRYVVRPPGPGIVAAGALGVAFGLLVAMRPVALTLFAPLGWLGEPWNLDPFVRADLRLSPGGSFSIRDGWSALVVIGVGWAAVAVAAIGQRGLTSCRRPFAFASALSCAFASSLVPVAAHRAVGAAFAATLGAAMVFTAIAIVFERARRDPLVPLIGAAIAMIPASGWAATNRWMTVVALSTGAIAFIALAIGSRRDSTWRSIAIAAGAVCAIGAVTTLYLAIGRAAATTAVIVAIFAAIVVVTAAHLPRTSDTPAIVATGSLALAFAALLAVGSLTHVATVLTIAAVALTATSFGVERSVPYRWTSAAVALGALLTWLAAAGVTLVEAYSVPIGAAALVGGAVVRRGRQNIGSWLAYGPGLTIILGPSLIASLDDGPTWRILLVAAAALASVAVGAASRLQAPIVVGAGALLGLAIEVGAPVADEVPRWIPIGVAGLLLLWFGATFERRMTTVRRAAAAFRRLD